MSPDQDTKYATEPTSDEIMATKERIRGIEEHQLRRETGISRGRRRGYCSNRTPKKKKRK